MKNVYEKYFIILNIQKLSDFKFLVFAVIKNAE